MKLLLETKAQNNRSLITGNILVAPPIDETYWAYKVEVSENQSIVGFPKFLTIGIGFMVEAEDWNTNLPFTSPTSEILNHIWVNRGKGNDSNEFKARCLRAIRLIQRAVRKDRQS